MEVNMMRRERVYRFCGAFLMFMMLLACGALGQEKGKKLPPPAKPFDINTATFDQFHSLPGVGPVTAQRILDYRKKSGPFQRVEDLLAVRGISAGRLEKIRPYVMVKPPASPPTAPKKPAAPKEELQELVG
jgi:competence ComEA-like helix-hairpin-helix protein